MTNAMTFCECPKCDPLHPELDECGMPYACYFCGDSGVVPQATADRYWQDRQDEVEYAPLRPVEDGKFWQWRGNCEDSWQVSMPLLPVDVFPHKWSPQAGMFLLPRPVVDLNDGTWDDDIPF